MTGDFLTEIILFFVLLVFSAFFSGSETALTAASRARMHRMEQDGNKRAAQVNKLREEKDRLIGGLLLGNNLVNISASALATSVMIKMFGETGVAYATLGVTVLVLIFAEVMPKTYALLHPDRLALVVAPFVSAIVFIFSPVTREISRLVNLVFRLCGVSKDQGDAGEAQQEELRGAIDLLAGTEAEDDDGEGQETRAMLRSILDLADVKVEKIMVHRKNVRMINADQPLDRIVDEVMHSSFTRLPVWRESPDNIIGVIHTKLLLQELRQCDGDVSKLDLARAMMEPWFIPESATLFDQLQAFRRRREHFAIMVDEYGALIGVITLEDILEEIVGQIDDEHDIAVSGVKTQPDGSYIVDGKVTLRDLNRDLGWGMPDEDYSTIAGLILYESQRIPSVGQSFTFYGFRFDILKKQRNQITLVRMTRVPADGGTDGDRMREVGG
jgi:Mg2+/Co2+ transporter CorB